MATTPNYALRYPVLTDTANVPRDLGYLAADVDTKLKQVDDKFTPAWTAPTLTNGWTNFGAGTIAAGYRLRGGVVELRGTIKGGSAAVAAFTLPVGSRPSAVHLFTALADPGVARLDVGSDGVVTVRAYAAGGSNAIVSLNGVSFSTV